MLFLLISSTPFYTVGRSQSSFDSEIQKKLNIGEYDSAISLGKKAVSQAPANSKPLLYNLLGKSHFGNKNFDSAIFYFNKSLKINPSDAGNIDSEQAIISHLNLATIYKNAAKVSQLNNELTKAVEIFEKNPMESLKPYILLGKANSYNYTDVKKAHQYFIKSIEAFDKKNPDILDAYDKFLDFLLSENKIEEAGKYMKDALDLGQMNFSNHKPKYANLLLMKSYYLHVTNKNFEAIELLDKSFLELIKNRKSGWAYYMTGERYRLKGWIYNSLNYYSEAIENTEKYLPIAEKFYRKDSRRFYQIYTFLYDANKKLGNYSLAKEYIDLVITIGGKSEDPEIVAAALLANANDLKRSNLLDQARKQFLEIRNFIMKKELNPFYGMLISRYLSEIYYEQGDNINALKESIKSFILRENLLGIDPESCVNYYDIQINSYLRLGEKDKADSLMKYVMMNIDFSKIEKSRSKILFLNHLNENFLLSNDLDQMGKYIDLPFGPNNINIKLSFESKKRRIKGLILVSLRSQGVYFKRKFEKTGNVTWLQKSVETFKLCQSLMMESDKLFQFQDDRIIDNSKSNEILELSLGIAYELYNSNEDFVLSDQVFNTLEFLKSTQLNEAINRDRAISKIANDTIKSRLNNLRHRNLI